MVFSFNSWLKRKINRENGLEDADKYRYSNPPPKRPSEYIKERTDREALYSELMQNGAITDYATVDNFAKTKAKESESVWDKLLKYWMG